MNSAYKMPSPQVNVIMAAYNCERHIREAVDSILNQTLTDFELVVVNDGSTDGTAAILSDYARRDVRVKIVEQDNAGPAAARNTAIAHSRSDFVALLDADDIAHPQRLEKQFAFLTDNPAHAAVTCLCQLINEQGRLIKTQSPRKTSQDSGLSVEELLKEQILVNGTAMLNLPLLKTSNITYRPWFRILEDVDFSLRIAENYKVAHINDPPLYQYRQYPAKSENLMNQDPALLWYYWCAATLSAHHRRIGKDDPVEQWATANANPRSLIPALADLPHSLKAACMKNARHRCRRLLRQGASGGAEQIVAELTTLPADKNDMRVLRKILMGILFYALRAGEWAMALRLVKQLCAPAQGRS